MQIKKGIWKETGKWKNSLITSEEKKQLYYELHKISVDPTEYSATATFHSLLRTYISSIIAQVQVSCKGKLLLKRYIKH